MPIPDYQALMVPLLKVLSDGREHALHEVIEELANQFGLSEAERVQLLPSGHQYVFDNRVGWTRTYLKKAGLVESPKRGFVRITSTGAETVASNPARIDVKFLEQFPAFVEFHTARAQSTHENTGGEGAGTPEESLENAYQTLRRTLAVDLLTQMKSSPPHVFERVVVELLVRMGYGGSLKDAGQAVGKSGDEGIDGIIKEDRLGLDIIYIQAKRWEGTVSRPEIQKFAGALQGQRAKKGVFITTSSFTKEALEFASRIDSKIVLVDGEQLAEFMIDHNIGVTAVANYEVKRLDTDYFAEE